MPAEKLVYGKRAVRIDTEKHRVDFAGRDEPIEFESLISSMPLTRLIALSDLKKKSSFAEHAALLRHSSTHVIGLGIAGGFTTASGIHVGARFLYFLGENELNIFDFGVEAGYSFTAGPLRFIPSLGRGMALFTEGTRSSPVFYLSPGAWLRLQLDGYYAGIDTRVQFVFASPTRRGLVIMLAWGLSY